MKNYRGTLYSNERILSAAEGIGYLVWPKIIDDRCYGDESLDKRLEGALSGDDYSRNVALMRDSIDEAIRSLKSRHVSKVRLGTSWAEGETPGGWHWISWCVRRFHEEGFEILPSLNYVPHEHATNRIDKLKKEFAADPERSAWAATLKPYSNIPPEPLDSFGKFVERFLAEHKDRIGGTVELWNEPNLDTDWNDEIDATGDLFVGMLTAASAAVRGSGRKVLLGGLTKFNESIAWLRRTCPHGLLDHIDALGLHGLRGTWSDTRKLPSWKERIGDFKRLMAEYTDRDIPVWMTEVGFTTVDLELSIDQKKLEEIQASIFADLMLVIADGDAERVYWYAERDLVTPSVRFLTTGWEDVLQYYFGDTDTEGNPKLLRELLEDGGPVRVLDYVEAHQIWELADYIIDRGDPKELTTERMRTIVQEMAARAEARGTRQFKEAA